MPKLFLCFFVCALLFDVAFARGTARVIYGSDDRLDYYEVSSSLQDQGESSVIILFNPSLEENEDGTFTAIFGTAQEISSFCADEPFSQQEIIEFSNACSGFLLSTNPPWIGTAAHCVEVGVSNTVIIFGFEVLSQGNTRLTFAADSVYHAESVLVRGTPSGGANDYGVFVLDRPVVGYQPYTSINDNMSIGDDLVMIGHPVGLPKKFDSGAEVVALGNGILGGTTDSYGGNSGSPVFDRDGNLAGILVGGAPDFVYSQDGNDVCRESNVCPGGRGCTSTGENIVVICDLLNEEALSSLALCSFAVSDESTADDDVTTDLSSDSNVFVPFTTDLSTYFTPASSLTTDLSTYEQITTDLSTYVQATFSLTPISGEDASSSSSGSFFDFFDDDDESSTSAPSLTTDLSTYEQITTDLSTYVQATTGIFPLSSDSPVSSVSGFSSIRSSENSASSASSNSPSTNDSSENENDEEEGDGEENSSISLFHSISVLLLVVFLF